MEFKIGEIGFWSNRHLEEISQTLRRDDIPPPVIVENLPEQSTSYKKNFKEYVIFCVLPKDLSHYSAFIHDKIKSWFSIYYYSHFYSCDMISLHFDFLIVGNQWQKYLQETLHFVNSYYWSMKKNHHASQVSRRLLLIIQKSEP